MTRGQGHPGMAPSSPNGLWFTDNHPLRLGAVSKKTSRTLAGNQSSRVRFGPGRGVSEGTLRLSSSSVSDQPQAVAVPRQKGLRRIEGEECHS